MGLRDMPDTSAGTDERRLVLNIIRMTIHNGPGYRTLILFKGCPLRCVWCSTPESQKRQPELAVYPHKCLHCGDCAPACPLHAVTLGEDSISINRDLCNNCGACLGVCYPEAIKLHGQYMTVEELLEEARKDAPFWKHTGGGITISGGEPLLEPVYAQKLLQMCKDEGISVGVDTSGHVPWRSIELTLPQTDFFLWDIKHMNPEKHLKYTGVSNELILKNARQASHRGVPIYVRIPVIPGYNDDEQNIQATSEFAANLPSLVELHLIPIHHLGKARYESLDREYPIAGVPLIPDALMERMKRLVESYGLECRIGG